MSKLGEAFITRYYTGHREKGEPTPPQPLYLIALTQLLSEVVSFDSIDPTMIVYFSYGWDVSEAYH